MKIVTGKHCLHGTSVRMDFDSARSGETHDPDVLRSGAQKLADLRLEIPLVLAGVRVINGQQRSAFDPAWGIRHVSNGDVRRPQRASIQRVADLKTHFAGLRICSHNGRATGERVAASRSGRAVLDGMTVRKLLPGLRRDLIWTKGSRAGMERWGVTLHASNLAPAGGAHNAGRYAAFTSATSFVSDALASPNSIDVRWS